MKINFLLIFTLNFGMLYGGHTSDQISFLHKEIGKGLINIRKENPELQDEIYSLLDQMGKLCRLSNLAIQKKKNMKLASKEEREKRFILKIENEKLRSKVVALRTEIKNESVKLAENKRRINSLIKEKSELAQRGNDYETREREYRNRVKQLESSLVKPSSFAEEVSAKLSKNKQIKSVVKKPSVNKIIST